MSYPSNKLEDDLGHMLNTWQQLQLHTSHIKSINYQLIQYIIAKHIIFDYQKKHIILSSFMKHVIYQEYCTIDEMV